MSQHFPWEIPASLTRFYERLESSLSDAEKQEFFDILADNETMRQQFHFTLATSKFVGEEIIRRPHLLIALFHEETLSKSLNKEDFFFAHISDSKVFDTQLRVQRAKAMIRIIWRDFNRLCAFEETTRDLSNLACASIELALEHHYKALEEKFGTPTNQSGQKQPFIVLGMGKLGAYELNLSSDIDLIFAYPEKGQTNHPSKPIDNHDFFTRLGKKVIQSLDAKTAEGIVFRVDMRLRPYGQSGALVYSFDALEEYYQNQGREWERYAMVKARVVANNGAEEYTQKLENLLRNFTYRRYIDFSVIDALRNLKKMITQEVARRRLHDDVKLGSGGIREIEFTAQVFQLIRGGREQALQDNRILTILPRLVEGKHLPGDTVNTLIDAYIFLRNVEHAIQGFSDCQTQQLPSADSEREALRQVMGFDSWESFYGALENHRKCVQSVFASVIAPPETSREHDKAVENPWIALWQQRLDESNALKQLEEAGHENPEQSHTILNELNKWCELSAMHATSRERLDDFMPILLAKLAEHESPTETLRRLITLIKSVARRSAYLLLLIENRGALTQLVKLSTASPWIADTLSEHPALLDELLDPDSLYNPPQKSELESELRRSVLRISEDDLESQMETLRYFRSAHVLRVAASEISEALPLMKVSDYLTWIAEVILEYVLILSWNAMVKKHGYPDGIVREQPNFIIVGYGKLGGIELGHGSDLDLVFIHDADLNGQTDGDRSLDNQTFFTRLGQKVIHFLTTNMSSGPLYEVDMRLRPSGNSGMLVTSIRSFEKYQEESAWTWEHQALVRARVIAGEAALDERFNDVRRAILGRQRDLKSLREDVIDMRLKMREHLGSPRTNSETFHLKQDAGGIVDIEFMVQYGVLAWAHSHPALMTFTDNIRILESFANSNLLTAQEVCQLTEAYKAFRAAGHRLTLQQQPNLVDAGELVSERQAVQAIWTGLMGTDECKKNV